jgi:hypothetical protein
VQSGTSAGAWLAGARVYIDIVQFVGVVLPSSQCVTLLGRILCPTAAVDAATGQQVVEHVAHNDGR